MSKKIDLPSLQLAIASWRLKNFGKQRGTQALGKGAEELGELFVAHANRNKKKQADGVGDVAIVLMGYCAETGMDFATCLVDAWIEVSKRDYRKYPGKGRP